MSLRNILKAPQVVEYVNFCVAIISISFLCFFFPRSNRCCIFMGEGTGKQMLQGAYSIRQYDQNYAKREDGWVIMEGDDDHDHETTSTTTSNGSTSSSDLVDDASSSASSSCSSSLRSGGSLFDLSDLMAQLPIK